jgi:hypothetical protein
MKNDSPPWQEDPKNPTRRSGEKRKDKYGNEIKNVAKHLARKAMNTVKEAVFKNYPRDGFPEEGDYGYHANPGLKPQESDSDKDMDVAYKKATEQEARKPLNAKIVEHDNCGTPDCCQTCDTADLGEASAFGDARRDLRRDSKGLAPTKRDEDDSESKEDPDEDKTPHLVSQLYKAVSINKAVKFKDGKSHTIAPHHAKKFINQYRSLKPADKEELQSKAHASHAEFKKAISEELVEDNDMPKGLQDRSPRGSARGAMGRAIARKERNLTRARMDRAKKAGAKLKMDPDTGTPDHFTAAQRRKKGLPEETKLDTKGNMKEAAAYQPSAAYQASRNANPYAKQHQDSIDRRNASIKRSRDAVAERQRKKAEELRSGLKTVKEEAELEEAHGMWKVDFPKQHAGKAVAAGSVHVKAQNTAHAHKVAAKRVGVDHKMFKSKVTKSSILPEELGKSNEWGTDALRQKYAAATPGQEGLAAKKIPTFDARYDDVPTRYIGGIQKEETLSEISARGVIARQDFKAKLQKVLSDPKAIARAKKTIAKKKAAEADVPKNLVHQLHKSQSINAKVKFYDGKEHEIASNHHDKFMNKYHGLKSSIEKESLVNRAHKSHEEFLKAIHEEWADFSQEKPNTDSINPANYPTPPMHNDMLDYNSDDRHDEYDMVAIENDVTSEIENAEWADLVDYYDYEDLNYEDSDEDIAEGITPQGRLKKRFNMMRTKGRRNLARNMALKRVATPDRIKSRSVRAARNMVYSRVLRGRDRSSLSASEKTRLEGMVKRMAPMVGRLSIRLQQKERMIDRKRINNRNKRKKK